MNVSLINPYIRVAMYSVIPAGRKIARRVIYDYELIYLEKGQWTFDYDGAAYPCAAGDFIFIRPGIPHSFCMGDEEVSQPHIHFDITYRMESEKIPVSFKDKEAMTETERGFIHRDYFSAYAPTPFLKIQDKAAFRAVFFRILSKDTDPLMKKSLMIQLLAFIINDNFPSLLEKQSPSSILHQIKNYIDAGNGFCASLTDISRHFHYDKFHLERKFKSAFGISLIAYRNRKRMDLAKELLKSQSVSAVAETLGFRSIYSFSRAYKMHFGAAPTKDAPKHGGRPT